MSDERVDPIIVAETDEGPGGECQNGRLACAGPAAFDRDLGELGGVLVTPPICEKCARDAAGLKRMTEREP